MSRSSTPPPDGGGSLRIDANLCVHRLASCASCDACVRACPTAAWSTQGDGLSFDPDRCDDCGRCVAACPPGALSLPARPPIPVTPLPASRRYARVTLACAPAMAMAPPAIQRKAADLAGHVVPCLHGIDEARLLQWQQDGVRHLGVTHPDCRNCRRHRPASNDLGTRVADVNQVLRGRGQETLRFERVAWENIAWQCLPAAAPPAHAPPSRPDDRPAQMSRRNWLGSLARPGPAPAPAAPAAPRPGRVQACDTVRTLAPGGPVLWSVHWIDTRCDGCSACARLCPTGAITLVPPAPEAGAPAGLLRFDMGRCTGCQLCIDACAPQALQAARPASGTAAVQAATLALIKCSTCGKHYAGVTPNVARTPGVCPACRSVAARRSDRVVQPATASQAPDQ